MKKGLILCLALVMALAMAAQAYVRNVPNPKLMEPTATPTAKVYPASKDQADSVVGDLHAFTAYISTVRCIAMDPTAGAAFVAYRNAAGGSVNYLGTTDNGASYQISTGLNTATTNRYPSAMADIQNASPWACWNTGVTVVPEKGAWFANDAGGYNAGLWNAEVNVDTLGKSMAAGGMYIGTAFKGTNGVVHWVHNYWDAFTPDAAFYYRSTDDGASWSGQTPRSGNLMMYDYNGTYDSTNLFGAGNPVVMDSITPGYINQVALAASASGETLMVGSCGLVDENDVTTERGTVRFWYRMSYDGGLNWTPFTYAPNAGWISWEGESYDLGIAIDSEGYPHFASFLLMDTTDAYANPGPNSGLYDYHLTAGGWVMTLIHAVDASYKRPRFANFGRDAYGNLILSYADNSEGVTPINIWAAMTKDNGATYTKYQVTTDGAGYDYPHIPMVLGDSTQLIPVWYQRGAAGFITWISWHTLGVEGGKPPVEMPHNFTLNQSRPNPVNKLAELSFTLPKSGNYSLKIYNIAGQVIRTLDGKGTAGQNTVTWNGMDNGGRKVANGVYLYNLNAFGNSATKKLVVVR